MDSHQQREVPKSIRRVDTCTTCKHVFAFCVPDEQTRYFCTLGAPPRPRTFMENIDAAAPREDVMAAFDAFDDWGEKREVREDELCDEYQPKDRTDG